MVNAHDPVVCFQRLPSTGKKTGQKPTILESKQLTIK